MVRRAAWEPLGYGGGLSELDASQHEQLRESILGCVRVVEDGEGHSLVEVSLPSLLASEPSYPGDLE
eukprot:53570-Eustigmatos_ZCMA.PRE.1